jgi:glycosyltransferase involved in cell wall biosynthesis
VSGITAILPAYNEEVSIGSVVLRTRKYADRVIVVDDGSSDRTAEVAQMAGAEVIRHPQNRGKGAALKTGLLDPGGVERHHAFTTEAQRHRGLLSSVLSSSSDICINITAMGCLWVGLI